MKRLLLAFLLLMPVHSVVAQNDADVAAAEAAALDWLALTDNGAYAASWQEASSFFRAAITNDDWSLCELQPHEAYIRSGYHTHRLVMPDLDAPAYPSAPQKIRNFCRHTYADDPKSYQFHLILLISVFAVLLRV